MHRMREFTSDLLFSGIDVIGRQNCRNLERLNHLNGLGTPALRCCTYSPSQPPLQWRGFMTLCGICLRWQEERHAERQREN